MLFNLEQAVVAMTSSPMFAMTLFIVAIGTCVATDIANTVDGCSAFPAPLSSKSADFRYGDFGFDVCTPELASCSAAQCACLGLPYEGTGKGCTGITTKPCSNASRCVRTFIECVNLAVTNANATKSPASDSVPCDRWSSSIHLADLEVAFDVVLYNESWLFAACRSSACSLMLRYVSPESLRSCPPDSYSIGLRAHSNDSTPLPYSEMCVSPVVFFGTLVLDGNFTILFTTQYAELVAALARDLTNVLLIQTTIVKLALGSLIIDFSVPVTASDPTLVARLAIAASGDSWLVSTKAAFVAAGGDLSNFGIRSIGATPTPTPGATPDTTGTP
ncbi:MAG: hypothetical protein Q8J97_11600, partial [Flavobacteriaceae bacterium]|nr:hypothetical protein [Flavobacteriaceae bacterium]